MSASMAARRYFTVLFRLGGHRRVRGAILASRLRSRFPSTRHRWRSEQGRLIVALVAIGSSAPRARSLAPPATVKSMPAQQHRGPAGQI